jgi:uncharacterized protein (DUF1501 family)
MNNSRRDFLKKSGGCALGMAALATQMHHLGIMSAFAQKTIEADGGTTPYRALVCLYLAGGNDGNNMIIPNHGDSSVSNYTSYSNARSTQGLAIPQNQLLPITVPRMSNLTYGFHPALGTVAGGNDGIYPLWATGDLAAVVNVGTLVRPMLRSEYQANSVQRPYQLFSHSDQVAQSQSANSATPTFTGWGGRMSDRMTTTSALVPMITSIRGAQLFTAGQTTLPIAIADSNTALSAVLQPAGYNGNAMSNARLAAFNAIRQDDINTSSSNYVKAAAGVTESAMDANALLQTWQEVTVTFPNTDLGRQLKQVARLIKKRTDLQITRQIFYVQVGGSFDTHSNQLVGQQNLFVQLSQAMRAFWDELVVQGMQDSVTTFTLSDFNRTLNPAGSGAAVGSDHAWGNHMLVMGGAVNGGNFYGSRRKDGTGDYFPTLTQGGPDDTDGGTAPRGRWIPTTSTEQYVARLARWFGLPQDATTLETVFPNLDNFPTTHEALDFMAP